jgi:hypothetical protein
MFAHADSVAARRPRRDRARSRSPAAIRKRRQRANQEAGRYWCRGFWLSGRALESLIMRLVLEGWLTEAQALQPKLVDQALAELLEEEGQRLAR